MNMNLTLEEFKDVYRGTPDMSEADLTGNVSDYCEQLEQYAQERGLVADDILYDFFRAIGR
jgi:hypothetical protein